MSDSRPKLLFLALHFPPFPMRGIRTQGIARYLSRLGWKVTVVTPDPSVWRTLENVEESDASIKLDRIERVLTGYSWRCLAPDILNCRNEGLSWVAGGVCRTVARRLGIDDGIGWIKPAEQACSSLTPNDVDVILATGAPFTSFEIAKHLADRLGRPYVLDYRDPWTGNPHIRHRDRPGIVQKEAKLLAGSAAVTIVSPSWGSAMSSRFGIGAKLHVMTNGYDPEELAMVKPYPFDHFAIVYTGNFYPPKRVITPLMAALKNLKQRGGEHGDWYFHYYGVDSSHVREEAARFGVLERTVLHGNVTRGAALSAVRGAGLAVVINSVADVAEPELKGMVPGKLYETIGLGKPMLLIAPGGCDLEPIIANAGGVQRFTGSDIDGISNFLLAATRGLVPLLNESEPYAWTSISKQFDSLLRVVADGSCFRSLPTERKRRLAGPA